MSDQLPLAGLRVLDLSAGTGSAAACVRLLAQLGAAVRAHDARQEPQRVARLAARADVTVLDLRPAESRRLGLDAPDLLGLGRVVLSATPYGLDGPYAERTDETPASGGANPRVAAALAGAHAAVAALAALRWARRHGRGALVEVATLEVVAACLGDLVPRAACPRRAPESPADTPPPGSAAVRNCPRACLPPALPTHAQASMPAATDEDTPASRAPAPPASASRSALPAVLPCADGYVALSLPSAVDRDLLAGLSGVDAVRGEDTDLGQALGPWLAVRTRDEIFHAAQLWRLPILPVLSPAEVYADAQCAARGVWAETAGRRGVQSPFRFSPHPNALPGGEGEQWRPADSSGAACPTGRPIADETPLGDLRVLDLGMVWAGPYCGRLLAGLGARVVKVEAPTRRDGTRPADPAGCAGAFGDLNRAKESLVLDLASASARVAFLRLAARADVVLENFSPRVMPNFGLDYAALAGANPALLMLSLPAFGASGPWGHYVAYGSGLELATGLAATVDGRPVPAPVAYLDYLAGAYGAAGLLAALLARDGSGRGAHVELAQREVACQLLADTEADGATPVPWSLDAAALASDPHLLARGLFATPPVADGAHCYHYARLPWRLHGAMLRAERPAPLFGADSRRVLAEVAGDRPLLPNSQRRSQYSASHPIRGRGASDAGDTGSALRARRPAPAPTQPAPPFPFAGGRGAGGLGVGRRERL